MKAILVSMTLLMVSAMAHANPVLVCKDIEIGEPRPGEGFHFRPSGVSVEVAASAKGKRGFIATMSSADSVKVETDVAFSVELPAIADEAQQIAEIAFPEVKFASVAKVRVANVGVQANQDDAAGIVLYQLVGKDERAIATLGRFGWGVVRCK